MLWYRLEDLNSAECELILRCLPIGHIQYLSFCSSVQYIMLQFKTAVFYATIVKYN